MSSSTSTIDIMQRFSTRTGLDNTEGCDPYTRRYLWTDAFAVANYLQLASSSKDAGGESGSRDEEKDEYYRLKALDVVESVHNSLGKFRKDDKNGRENQWLSGSSLHPTANGLRIGKSLNEKELGETYDSNTEWDKDGQYFHYLTKWMTALDIITRKTGETKYTEWAMELMKVAAKKFIHHDLGRPAMYWKMSIDLSRPQVLSQGASDPIDGYITLCQLLSTSNKYNILVFDNLPEFYEAKRIFLSMVHITSSEDPLG